MEPRSAERGNYPNAPYTVFEFSQLQWSHAQPSVETAMPPIGLERLRKASMEPRSAERGNGQVIEERRCESDASMEPRSAERGNIATASENAAERQASMEPRSAERGNSAACAGHPQWCACFNGATLSRAWKPVVPGSKLPETVYALQWSHAQPSVETSNPAPARSFDARAPGFNGATLSRAWKPGIDKLRGEFGWEASMEPRSAERGNQASVAWRRR